MRIVYVAGPYMGATHDGKSYYQISKNILEAREWAKKIIEAGAFPFTPHLNSYHMECDVDKPADWWREADLEMLRRCDAIFLIPGWQESKGARMEKEFALRSSIPVFYDLEILCAWIKDGEVGAYYAKMASERLYGPVA